MNKKLPIFILILICLYVVVYLQVYSGGIFNLLTGANNNIQRSEPEKIRTVVVSEEDATIKVVKIASPAVVSVIRKDTYFDYRSGPIEQEDSIGTGFIIDGKSGIVLTNKHVVDSEDASYSVYLNETDQQYDVIRIARDPVNDFSVLKIKLAQNETLPELDLGDSDALQIGQTVIAIGNALGEFGNSVTKGIVSGLNRGILASSGIFGTPEYIENVIQTDAALNPGNSGGPLLNLQGEVVGINVAISGGAENIGFSIPVNTIKSAIDQFTQTGKIARPFLGVQYRVLTADIAEVRNLPAGIYIDDVINNSPADDAGLKRGDIITEVDGQKLDEDTSLAKIISQKKIGDKVKLTVYRDNDTLVLTATLQDAEQ